MVLIITSTFDDECDAVVKELKRFAPNSYFRLNADRLYDYYKLEIDLSTATFHLKHKKTGKSIQSKQIRKVWWARYELPGATFEWFDKDLSGFIDDEYYSSLIAIQACLDKKNTPTINHPIRNNIGSHKPYQQLVAKSCGFNLPEQLITNDTYAFIKTPWHQNSVYKPISNSQYLTKNKNKYFATVKEINENLLDRIKTGATELYIHHFQQKLEVKKEYRVTVFGNHVFAFRIDGKYGFDWRQYLEKIKYTFIPDFQLSQSCIDYLKEMGIQMGCFDFIQTPEGKFYFLECNAPGFFMFCDPRSKYGLAKAFAEFLIQKS